MKIEHIAINVEQPVEMADWYIKNLGLRSVKRDESAPYTSFLADDSGKVMLEMYRNPPESIPDYHSMDPLTFHLAFVSHKPAEDKERLTRVGATFISERRFEDGTHLVMLKDPWGLSLQLCKRGEPMLK